MIGGGRGDSATAYLLLASHTRLFCSQSAFVFSCRRSNFGSIRACTSPCSIFFDMVALEATKAIGCMNVCP